MDYLLEGVGNEFLFFILTYILIIGFFLKFLRLDLSLITESITQFWQYLRNSFMREDIPIFSSNDIENDGGDPGLDVRIFNTDCCVCLSEDCNCPVTSICGHCFCGTCAMNLIEHSSVPMKCPLCRQECRVLFLPFREERNTNDSLHYLVSNSVTSYNARAEHRFPFVNRVRNAPVMLRHLMRSFITFRGHLVFRLKCHIVAAVFVAVCYLVLSTDIIPERVFGLIGFIDDFVVVTFLTVLIARTFTSIDSSVTFDDIRAALE